MTCLTSCFPLSIITSSNQVCASTRWSFISQCFLKAIYKGKFVKFTIAASTCTECMIFSSYFLRLSGSPTISNAWAKILKASSAPGKRFWNTSNIICCGLKTFCLNNQLIQIYNPRELIIVGHLCWKSLCLEKYEFKNDKAVSTSYWLLRVVSVDWLKQVLITLVRDHSNLW